MMIDKKPKTSFLQKLALLFFGILLSLILIEAALRLGGFILLTVQGYRNAISLKDKGNYVILCLGESTTACGGEDSYPSQLERILNESGSGIKFTVVNKGIWATSSEGIASLLSKNLEKYSPDMVITMIGINDRTRTGWYGNRFFNFIHYLRIFKLMEYLTLNMDNLFWRSNIVIPSDKYYMILGRLYLRDGKFYEAGERFKKAIEVNPANEMAYFYLALYYHYLDERNRDRAELTYKKCIEVNPRSDLCYVQLGIMYFEDGRLELAEECLKKSVAIKPWEFNCLTLSCFYEKTSRLNKAIDVLESFRKSNQSYVVCGGLKILYQKQGDLDRAQEYANIAEQLRKSGYIAMTRSYYRMIAGEVLGAKKKLVCVQYPVRSVIQLKEMLEGYQGIIFVDNEEIFKDALSRDGYDYYFYDRFGGDFGHATKQGNKLLAENIANAILKAVSKEVSNDRVANAAN